MIPSDEQLAAAAARAVALAGGEAQATAWWERRAGHGDATGVEVVLVRDGRAREGAAAGLADDALRAAIDAAEQAPGEPSAGLPDPGPAPRAHQAFDPAVLGAQERDGVDARAGKVAIASSAGVAALERRTVVRAEAVAERAGRTIRVAAAAPALAGVDPGRLAAEAADLLGADAPVPAPAGSPTVVLGPQAVAVVLDRLRPRFAAGGERLPAGTRVAASAVALAESPRFSGTLARSLDAEGLARQPVPLVQDGVAHRVVSDSASGSGTGHATRPGRPAPRAEHLVLVGGGAADVDELLRPVRSGVLVHALEADGDTLWARGAFAIEDGRRGAALSDARVELDPVALLAGVQALTMRQRAIPCGPPEARRASATVSPALRTAEGLRILG